MWQPESGVGASGVNLLAVGQELTNTPETTTENVVETAHRLADGDLSALLTLLESFVMPVVTALLLMIVAFFAASFIARVASAPVRKRVDETLGRFVAKLVYYSIIIFALLGVLGKFGVSVSSFAAVVAAAGFAIGLAFQGTLSNFAAGVLLLVFRPFKVGDVINAAGITANVYEIDLFSTTFDTPDNRRIIVPNSAISSGTIENVSHHNERRVDISVDVSYSASLDKTRETLTSAAESLRDKLIDGQGRGYQIVLTDLGESAVKWSIRFWASSDDFWGVRERLTAQVKNRLDSHGIGIPFPQLDVHVTQEN